jgi:putative oxidoreductase
VKEHSGILLLARSLLAIGQFIVPSLIALIASKELSEFLATYGLPDPGLLEERFLCLLLLFAGVMLLFGVVCRKVALFLFFVGIGVGLWKLRFWELSGLQQYVVKRAFMDLLIVQGGLLLLMVLGPGRFRILSRERDWQQLIVGFSNWGALLARLLIGGAFIWIAISRVVYWEVAQARMNLEGIPFPEVSAAISLLIELACGLMLVVGWRLRVAALILALYIGISAWMAHPFWVASTFGSAILSPSDSLIDYLIGLFPVGRLFQIRLVFDQLAIIGTLLLVWACPPGRYAIDR